MNGEHVLAPLPNISSATIMSAPDLNAFLHCDDWRKTFAGNLAAQPWQVVYGRCEGVKQDGLVYSALIPSAAIAECLKDHSWDLRVGGGSPGTSVSHEDGTAVVKYDRLGFLEGIEPLVLCRSFHHSAESFRELTEEFRLFHNLYQGKKREEYLKTDDAGNPEVVARILPDRVEIRTKEIRQFLAIKEMHLSIQLDLSRYAEIPLGDLEISDRSELFHDADACFHWGVRDCDWRESDKIHAYFMGKKLLPPFPKDQSGRWPFHESDDRFPTFIIGRDDDGKEVEFTCEEGKLANYFGANPDAPHFLTPVHFRSDVLARYYSNPERFSVEDGFLRASGLWGLRMDNDHQDRVVVFLGDLGRDLPASERDYWRSFNIAPDGPPISKTAFKRSIRGWFSSPERPDLAFKNLFPYFGGKWRAKFGWDLFRPLAADDEHHFTTVRIPLQNDQGEFDAQVQSLTKLVVDSLNEAVLVKGLLVPAETKGIDKFQLFLEGRKVADAAKIARFLRDLQALRSSGVAHRKGSNYEKVAKLFDLENRELKEVAAELFGSSLQMLQTLGSHFIPEVDWRNS
jgi:hypothetical protein